MIKTIKTILSVLVGTFFISSAVLGATILTTDSSNTIGTFRTNVNTSLTNLNAAITDTTSSLGLFASLASTTGNLIVGSSTQWRAMIVGSNGKFLTASSSAVGGLSWESGSGITSLGGSVSTTQTFATSGPLLSISTTNGVHTFTTLATSSLGLQSVLSFPLSYASTTHISFPIPYASTTGFSYATSGASGVQIASSSGQWTFSQTTSSAGVSGFLSGTDWTTFNGKQNAISFPIPVASTSLSANTPLSISGNILSVATATASVNGILTSTNWNTFNNKASTSTFSATAPIFYNSGTATFSLGITAVSSTRAINVGSFLTGGGDLSADRTISLTITPVSSTRAISAGSGLLGGGDLSADRTLYWNANVATATIATATTTNLSVTSTLYFTADGTKQTTAYKSFGFTAINTTSTASSGIVAAKLFYQPLTLTNLDCSTNGATVTISLFVRASSTPTTNGTTTIANVACTSSGFSTTTFTNAGFGGVNYLAFASSSVANSTTTLNVSGRYKE